MRTLAATERSYRNRFGKPETQARKPTFHFHVTFQTTVQDNERKTNISLYGRIQSTTIVYCIQRYYVLSITVHQIYIMYITLHTLPVPIQILENVQFM